MIRILLRTVADKPWLRLLALAFLISSIGNGITWIVVFSELIRLSAPVASLALAYVLSTVPGLLGSSNRLSIGCLAIFLLCYGLLPFSPSPYLALALVFVAHVFSNVVFSLAVYTLLRSFDQQQVPTAIARSYRLQMAISALVSIGAGYCSDAIGVTGSLYLFSGTGFVLIVALLVIGKAGIRPARA